MANKKTYEVKIMNAVGTCDSDMFRLMAEEGDLNATRIKEVMGENVTIKGFAKVEIKTEEKEFAMMYVDTDEFGLLSAGSEIFADSVEKYYNKGVKRFTLKEIKTKKGNTYKATPRLESQEDETVDDLPF